MGRKKEIPAGEFKARCLALLDEVAGAGDEIIVTKRGRPVARVVPLERPRSLRGSILWQGDVLAPIGDEWDADR